MITVYGANKTRSDLHDIDLPIRPEAPRWVGIQHGQLADSLEHVLGARGIEISLEKWSTSRDNQTLVGGVDLRVPASFGISEIDGVQYSLGVRHSNNGLHALSFMAGGKIAICLNGIATGEIILNRKHTKGVDIHEVLNRGITNYLEKIRGLSVHINDMKQRTVTQSRADNMLMHAGRARLLPWSGIGKVEKEYRNPRHDEFKHGTQWGLYNAFTEIAKKINPVKQLHAINGFRQIVSEQ